MTRHLRRAAAAVRRAGDALAVAVLTAQPRRWDDSGGIDGGFLLAFAVIIAVVLVYVAAGGAR